MEIRRVTAKVAGIEEVVNGKYVKKQGFESNYVLTGLGRKISRARFLGLVVDKYISEDGNYGTLTIDDGTDTIRCKVFVNTKVFDGITKGEFLEIIGKVREYKNEIYVMPEILRKSDPNLESLRVLELKKISVDQIKKIKLIKDLERKTADVSELKILASRQGIKEDEVEGILEADELIKETVEEITSKKSEAKDKLLKLLEEQDEGDGVEYQVLLESSGMKESEVDNAIQELLESGACMEPKAGVIKKV